MLKKFFHYSQKIDEIKKKGFIQDISFTKTNTYDLVLETCPELILAENEIKRLNIYKQENKKYIEKYEKDISKGDYESKYRDLKLTYKNQLLNEFFSHNKFVLAFDKKLPKGWIKWGMLQLLIPKIGKNFLSFEVPREVAEKSFVLEQKYWSPIYSKDKFGVNTWSSDFKIWENPKIFKDIFGKYYLSIKRLSEYKSGEFEVPEFWIYGKILTKDCKSGQIYDKMFNKLLKEREVLKKI